VPESELVLSAPADREPPVGPDAPLFDVMATMRAMRRLKPDPVPDDVLTSIVEAATWAPSGSNAQGFSFVVVTDRGQMSRLAEVWRRCVDGYLATMGTATPARTMGEEAAEKLRGALLFQRDHFAETPAVVVACYGYGRSPASDPRAAINMLRALGPRQALRTARMAPRYMALAEASSIYPSVQNLLLAARAHGLGANITIWHLPYEDDVKRILGIPKGVNTYALVPLGYPRGRFGPVRRRPVEAVIHRDRW
jgi:nitroreductase